MVPIKAALCLGTGGQVIKAIQHTEDTLGVGGGLREGDGGGEVVAFEVT